MDPQALVELLRKSPFQPFVAYMNDGSVFTVNHPDQAMVVAEVMYVAHENRGVRLALMNMTRVETVEISPPAST